MSTISRRSISIISVGTRGTQGITSRTRTRTAKAALRTFNGWEDGLRSYWTSKTRYAWKAMAEQRLGRQYVISTIRTWGRRRRAQRTIMARWTRIVCTSTKIGCSSSIKESPGRTRGLGSGVLQAVLTQTTYKRFFACQWTMRSSGTNDTC